MKQRLGGVWVVWVSVAILSLWAMAANAAQFLGGRQLELATADTIRDDLYACGGDIHIRGHVDGDLVIAGGKVSVSGPVSGDVVAIGGNVELDGPVGGTVRAFGGSVTAGGAVTRERGVAGG